LNYFPGTLKTTESAVSVVSQFLKVWDTVRKFSIIRVGYCSSVCINAEDGILVGVWIHVRRWRHHFENIFRYIGCRRVW